MEYLWTGSARCRREVHAGPATRRYPAASVTGSQPDVVCLGCRPACAWVPDAVCDSARSVRKQRRVGVQYPAPAIRCQPSSWYPFPVSSMSTHSFLGFWAGNFGRLIRSLSLRIAFVTSSRTHLDNPLHSSLSSASHFVHCAQLSQPPSRSELPSRHPAMSMSRGLTTTTGSHTKHLSAPFVCLFKCVAFKLFFWSACCVGLIWTVSR